MSGEEFSPQEFGVAYQRLMQWAAQDFQQDRSPFRSLLSVQESC